MKNYCRNTVKKIMKRTKREYKINIYRHAKENPKRFHENLETKVYPLLEFANDETSLRIEDHENRDENDEIFSSSNFVMFL